MTLATFVTAAVLQAIPFTTVAGGTASQIDEPRRVIVRTAEEFQALWKTHSSAPLPKVDFTQSIVVGVFLGTRPTTGYGVAVTGVRRQGKSAIVEWQEFLPDKTKMLAQMLTSPFHLVAIPRDSAPVEFLKTAGGG
ncbi:MAG TPA: protease complex subunit PrcB family protein [Vicinamibacterales bacterium]|nr:protease complex subunit PrcB family protein [Vicinamibacterales bacterium]